MVWPWCFHCGGPGSSPGWGTKIPQAMQHSQKKRKKKKEKPKNSSQNKKFLHLIQKIENPNKLK